MYEVHKNVQPNPHHHKTQPHYPDGKEMGFLPYYFLESLKKNDDHIYGLELSNLIKLYVIYSF